LFDKKRYFHNILFNWSAFFVSIAVGFFLSPFLVHHLGNTRYGYWSLVVTATAYFGYFDLGIQSGVGHYVARHLADKDEEKLNDKINSALTALLWIAIAVLVISVTASFFFSRFFHVPAEAVGSVRTVFFLMGLMTAALFPFSMFKAMLVGAQRFDIVSGTSLVIKLCNAAMVVLVFKSGKGLMGLAAVVVATHILEGAVLLVFARRVVPGVRFRPFFFRARAFGELFHYGAFNFLMNIAAQLGAGFWAFIIARKISAEAVTYYSVGSELLPYMAGLASAVTVPLLQIVIPMDVRNDMASLRAMYLTGTRYLCALVCLIGINLLLVGKAFLGQWMGEKFLMAEPYGSSATILILLTLANMAAQSSSVAQQILFGRRKNRAFAGFIAAETAAIVGMALMLVPRFGIVGMAFATLIPMAIAEGVLVPAFAARQTGASIAEYWTKAILPNAILVALVFVAGRAALPALARPGWGPVFLSFTLVTIVHLAAVYFFVVEKPHRDLILGLLWRKPALGFRRGA
jgi:O-antigen/teichoic acid export membrane protein